MVPSRATARAAVDHGVTVTDDGWHATTADGRVRLEVDSSDATVTVTTARGASVYRVNDPDAIAAGPPADPGAIEAFVDALVDEFVPEPPGTCLAPSGTAAAVAVVLTADPVRRLVPLSITDRSPPVWTVPVLWFRPKGIVTVMSYRDGAMTVPRRRRSDGPPVALVRSAAVDGLHGQLLDMIDYHRQGITCVARKPRLTYRWPTSRIVQSEDLEALLVATGGSSAKAARVAVCAPICGGVDDHCAKQVGGTCYYMSVLNFMMRATAVWRAIPTAADRLAPVLAFAAEMTACATDAGRRQLCAAPPPAMRPFQREYALLTNDAADMDAVTNSGHPGRLLTAIFRRAGLDTRGTMDVMVRKRGNNLSAETMDELLSYPTMPIHAMVASAVGVVPGFTLIGGVVTTRNHALSINMCSGDQNPYGNAIVCNSWFTVCRQLDDPFWAAPEWHVAGMTAVYVHSSVFASVHARFVDVA